MDMQSIEVIVLHNTPFGEKAQIVLAFSCKGLLKFYVPHISPKSNKCSSALITPLTKSEFCFIKGRGELLRFQEGKILNPRLPRLIIMW